MKRKKLILILAVIGLTACHSIVYAAQSIKQQMRGSKAPALRFSGTDLTHLQEINLVANPKIYPSILSVKLANNNQFNVTNNLNNYGISNSNDLAKNLLADNPVIGKFSKLTNIAKKINNSSLLNDIENSNLSKNLANFSLSFQKNNIGDLKKVKNIPLINGLTNLLSFGFLKQSPIVRNFNNLPSIQKFNNTPLSESIPQFANNTISKMNRINSTFNSWVDSFAEKISGRNNSLWRSQAFRFRYALYQRNKELPLQKDGNLSSEKEIKTIQAPINQKVAVHTKSGKVFEGKLLELTNQSVKIDFYGVKLTYFQDEINQIKY